MIWKREYEPFSKGEYHRIAYHRIYGSLRFVRPNFGYAETSYMLEPLSEMGRRR